MGTTIRGITDPVGAPTITEARGNGRDVWMKFSAYLIEDPNLNLPVKGDFTIKVGGSPVTVDAIRFFGNTVTLRLATAIDAAEPDIAATPPT